MASPFARRTSRAVSRGQVMGLLAVMAAILVPAAIAWACNPQAYLRLDKASYTPGEQMQVSGAFFKSGAELSLSLEPGGQVATVTTSSNGSFSTRVPAPSSAGSYTLSAVGFEADGSVTNGLPARTSFSVAAQASRPAQPGSTPQPGTSQPGTSRPGAAPPRAGRFAEPEVPRTRAFSAPTRRSSGRSREPATSRGGSGAGSVTSGAGVIAAPVGSTGQAVFAGSVARADRAAGAVAGRSPAAVPSRRGTSPSQRTAASESDVWSGFSSSKASGLEPRAGEAAPDGGAGSGLGLGLGLLGLGLLALVSGLTLAEVRRRRALQR